MIKLFISDVDGCLTNGQIHYTFDENNVISEGLKSFNVLDGAAILRAQKMGIIVAIITGRSSETLRQRARDLGITHLHMGAKNKLQIAQKLANELGINLKTQAAMLGDDLIDLELLKECAYAFLPADSKALFGYRLKRAGGAGCFDEALGILCSQKL